MKRTKKNEPIEKLVNECHFDNIVLQDEIKIDVNERHG
jgi:hypothetical protein